MINKIGRITLVLIMLLVFSACDTFWKGPAEITTQAGKTSCPDGLVFRGDRTPFGDKVFCLGSSKTTGSTRDLVFMVEDITSLSANKNQ